MQTSFIWGSLTNEVLSVFIHPKAELVTDFPGENPRPSNDLLLTEQIIPQSDNLWLVNCQKKHHLDAGHLICILDKDGKILHQSQIVKVESEKGFLVQNVESAILKTDCDNQTFVIKLLFRSETDKKYVSHMSILRLRTH